MSKNKKLYGVYIRVSTDKQAEHGDSIEMQKNLAKELIEKEGGTLYKFYIEEGVSASKSDLKDRKKLIECLNDIDKGFIDNLIAYRRDRLARKTEDSIAIRRILKKNNCRMVFTATGEQEMKLDDVYSKLIENVRSSLDEIESAQIAIRVSDTMFDKAKRGEFTGGMAPYGYENIEGYLKPVDGIKDVADEVTEMYFEGFGTNAIARWLEGKEVRNKGKRKTKAERVKQNKNSSDKWTREIVQSILFNPMYSGRMKYTRKLNGENETILIDSSYIEPIRSKKLQERIDAERENRRKKQSPPRNYTTEFLLTGIIVCAECGKKYASRSTTQSNGKKYSYYVCRGRSGTISPCPSKSYNKKVFEGYIIEKVKEYVGNFLNEDVYTKIKKMVDVKGKESENKLQKIKGFINKENERLRRIGLLLLDLDAEDNSYEMMKELYQEQQKEILKNIKELNDTKQELESEMKNLTRESMSVSEIIDQLEVFDDAIDIAPFHLKKQLIESLFSKIEVSKDGDVKLYLTFSIEDTSIVFSEPTIDFSDSGIMFNGVIGSPTTPKNISNYYLWLEQVTDFIENNIYTFITQKNPMMKSPVYFSDITGFSISMHNDYKLRKSSPSHENLKAIAQHSNFTLGDVVNFIKKEGFVFNENILEDVLRMKNSIRSS